MPLIINPRWGPCPRPNLHGSSRYSHSGPLNEWVAVLFAEPTATELALPYRPPCELAHDPGLVLARGRSVIKAPRHDRTFSAMPGGVLATSGEVGKASEEACGVLTVSNKIAPAAPKRRARGGKASRARRLENFWQHKAAAPAAAPAIKWEERVEV